MKVICKYIVFMLFIHNFNIFNIDAEKPFSGTLNKVYVYMYVCMYVIKQNGQINGITVNNEEFLLGQYADDTFFLLDGTQTSLSKCLDTLELFGESSGLKVNVEKTKAVWLGSKRFSKDILLPEKNLAWVFNEPFDILRITFFVETQQIVEYNYRMKLDEVRKLLDSWS